MKIIRDILQEKGSEVYAIPPHATVYETLQMLADKNVGALLVMQDDSVVGIISERDYARKVVLKGKFSKDVPVSEIMSSHILRIDPDQDIETCMELMSDKRVRHLPVFENGRVVGIISIGDIVKAIIEHKEETIAQLENYIRGNR
ncbi:MAG: CBS domain-containing protein [Desulfosalsimonadaceae bacterium]|nr:CBS domain-containing protein [Desulfosalsimonadaceae bacterium]